MLASQTGGTIDTVAGALHTDGMDAKETLKSYLRATREALLWKLEGLSERELRLPRTPTGTSLLGIVKHCASVEAEYFGACLGRETGITLPLFDPVADPNGDLYATATETAARIVADYRAVGEYVDRTIDEVLLDAPAHVPWWGDRADTTFERLLVHVLSDVARHAGHADILRESIDGAAGLRKELDNLWEPEGGWTAHVAKLTAIADGFSES